MQGRALAAGGAVFSGIPYAEPPVGKRRFRRPEPPRPWDGVRPATAFGAPCLQARAAGGVNAGFETTVEHSEDCLTLNVWTPAADDHRRPVVVWIHGGGFQSGGADAPVYAGQAFVQSDCVLVSVNYRLNAFGFLFLGDLFPTDAPHGNLGLLDQIAALEWVHENIAAFGGDSDNVTLAGQSAGAMSIGCLLAMPAAEGLFGRAILQSGVGRHVISRDGASRVARRVLECVDVTDMDWTKLQEVPAARLLDAARALTPQVVADLFEAEFSAAMAFQPVVDGHLLPEHPARAVAAGHAAGVDVMVGSCTDELRLVSWGMYRDPGDRPPDRAIPRALERVGTTIDDAVVTMSEARPTDTVEDHLSAIETGYRYTEPAFGLARDHHGSGHGTWLYRFDWQSPVRGGQLRACHGVDVPFVFDTLDAAPELVGDQPPRSLARAVHQAWTSFARDGNPSCEALGPWPPFSPETGATKVIDVAASIEDSRDDPVVSMWRARAPQPINERSGDD